MYSSEQAKEHPRRSRRRNSVVRLKRTASHTTEFTKSEIWKKAAEELFNAEKAQSRLRKTEELRHIQCIIYPDDRAYIVWCVIVSLILIYTATVTPFRLAFLDEETLEWFIIDLILDVLFFIDVMVNCILAYYDSDNNIVVDRREIFRRYLTSWMLVDLIACIPFQLLLTSEDKDYSSLIRVTRLPRLYRLIKLTKLIRMLKVIKYRGKLLRWLNNVLKIKIGIERILTFFITFLVTVHLFACVWVLIGRMESTNVDNWIFSGGYQDLGIQDLYFVALYWALMTLTTVGYGMGEYVAYNTQEKWFCAFAMLCGVFIYSFSVGSISNILRNFDSRKAKLRAKMNLLREIVKEHKISSVFASKLEKALEYEHNQNKHEVDHLIDKLPSHLRNKLLIIIHEKLIANNTFFDDKPVFFVALIAPMLQPFRVQAKEFVYRFGEIAQEMYFVLKGEVSYVFESNKQWISYLSIPETYYFGEVDLLVHPDKVRSDSARSETETEMLTLSEKCLYKVMQQFPEFAVNIVQISKNRLRRCQDAKERAIDINKMGFSVAKKVTYPISMVQIPEVADDSSSHAEESKQEETPESESKTSSEDDSEIATAPPTARKPDIAIEDLTAQRSQPLYPGGAEQQMPRPSLLSLRRNVIPPPLDLTTTTTFRRFRTKRPTFLQQIDRQLSIPEKSAETSRRKSQDSEEPNEQEEEELDEATLNELENQISELLTNLTILGSVVSNLLENVS